MTTPHTPHDALDDTVDGTTVGDGAGSGSTVADAAAGDAADAGARPQPRSRMRGSWRSLVLSMLAVGAVVLVLYAIVPRPEAVVQPPIDVTPVAQQVQRDENVTVWLPQLGEPGKPWKATSVRYQPTDQGPKAFYAGYHRTDDESVFVAVQQMAAKAPEAAQKSWITQAVANGTEQGTTKIDGKTWRVFATGGDPDRRGLVGEVGGMTTVVSGLADDATLTEVTRSLRPHQG